jgi:hypothetical protein
MLIELPELRDPLATQAYATQAMLATPAASDSLMRKQKDP